MTNLFDYATKELSQDAFIKWLISNYEEIDDPKLQEYSLDFISFLTNGVIPVSELLNAKIMIYSQVDHTDISIDIYPSKDSKLEDSHDVIVIEDKTFSSEHNQLIDYNKAIDKWKHIKRLFKVFYKTSSISSKDEEGIAQANKDTKSKWALFNLEKIWGFFKDRTQSKSQVLNDYIEYIGKIHSALNCETNDNISDWKPYHWEGFINKYLAAYNKPDSEKEEYVWMDNYQGRYVSICYQRCLPNRKDAAVLEMFVRNQNHISTTFHHAFYTDKDTPRKWSSKKCSEEQVTLRKKLIEYISKLAKNKEYNVQKVRSNASNSFGKFKDGITVNEKNKLLSVVEKWIGSFIKIIDEFEE